MSRLADRKPNAALKHSQNSETTISSDEPHPTQETVSPSQEVGSAKKRKLPTPVRSSLKKEPPKSTSRVHFSPEVVQRQISAQRGPPSSAGRGEQAQFGGVSPIPKSKSPGSSSRCRSNSSGDPTLGTSPPSCLKTSTMLSSIAPGARSDEESVPSTMKPSASRSKGVFPEDGLNLTDSLSPAPPNSQESFGAFSNASSRRLTRSQRRSLSQSQDSGPSQHTSLSSQRRTRSQSQESGPSKHSSLSRSSDELRAFNQDTPSQKKKQEKTGRDDSPAVPKSISISRSASTTMTAATSQQSSRSSKRTRLTTTQTSGASSTVYSENQPQRRNNRSNKRSAAADGEGSPSASKSAREDESSAAPPASKESSNQHRRRRRRRRIIHRA